MRYNIVRVITRDEVSTWCSLTESVNWSSLARACDDYSGCVLFVIRGRWGRWCTALATWWIFFGWSDADADSEAGYFSCGSLHRGESRSWELFQSVLKRRPSHRSRRTRGSCQPISSQTDRMLIWLVISNCYLVVAGYLFKFLGRFDLLPLDESSFQSAHSTDTAVF